MKIRVVVVPVGQQTEVREVESSLDAMQGLVGGLIQSVPYGNGLDLICNDEGKLIGLEPNRPIFNGQDYVFGQFFFCRTDEDGETASVTDEDIVRIRREFDV